jgi:hypothetical protein
VAPSPGTLPNGIDYTGGTYCTLTANYIWFQYSTGAFYFFAAYQNSPYVNITEAAYSQLQTNVDFRGSFMDVANTVNITESPSNYKSYVEGYAGSVIPDPTNYVTTVMLEWVLKYYDAGVLRAIPTQSSPVSVPTTAPTASNAPSNSNAAISQRNRQRGIVAIAISVPVLVILSGLACVRAHMRRHQKVPIQVRSPVVYEESSSPSSPFTDKSTEMGFRGPSKSML